MSLKARPMTIINLAKIKVHFDYLYTNALEIAKRRALLYVENLSLASLDNEHLIGLLEREVQKLHLEITGFNGKEYAWFVFCKVFLYKIYAARMLLYEIDDEEKLRNAFILIERFLLLDEHYQRTIDQSTDSSGVNGKKKLDYVAINLSEHHYHSPEMDKLQRSYQIVELIACMIPGQSLIERLYETITWIEKEVEKQDIPSNALIEHIKHSYCDLYRQGLINLKEQIESTSKDSMALIIISHIGYIKYLADLAELDGYVLHEHFRHLKKFLKDQLHNIQDSLGFKQPDIIESSSNTEIREEKLITFGPRPGPRPLRPIVVAMNLHYNLLGGSTTEDEFMEVVTCTDLSKNTKIVQLGIKYNLLYCFIKKLKPWFRFLRACDLERSGIFISPHEGPLVAKSLYNSGVVLMEDEDKIEAIVNAKYQ
jgi:hypothetical protein